jgi:hypothetical protein
MKSKYLIPWISLTVLALLQVLIIIGCAATKPAPDPLIGWSLEPIRQPDATIVKDYHDYIQNLPPKIRPYAQGPFWFLKDDTGKHAIKFEIPLNGALTEHVLIYDKDDYRIKVIVYSGGRYSS